MPAEVPAEVPPGMTAVDCSRARLVVLVSGHGSNLQAIIDGCRRNSIDGDVVAVVSNRADAGGLRRACTSAIPAIAIVPGPGEHRSAYDARLADEVAGHAPDVVVLAGWMRILTASFLDRFPGQVINLHPARPGELPGTHAVERAYGEFCAGARRRTGVMVHLVPDEGVDVGPVLATVDVAIHDDDTLDTLATRVHAAEHTLLVSTLRELCASLRRPREVRA